MIRVSAIMDKCGYCLESQKLDRHLVIALGTKCYLMLPRLGQLTDTHCLIVPNTHEGAATSFDDDLAEEVRNFKKCLIMAFVEQVCDLRLCFACDSNPGQGLCLL